jgi:hypothetical protein
VRSEYGWRSAPPAETSSPLSPAGRERHADLATGVLTKWVDGLPAWDPVVAILATGILGAAATFGCWLPVQRALRVDPAIVLRQE